MPLAPRTVAAAWIIVIFQAGFVGVNDLAGVLRAVRQAQRDPQNGLSVSPLMRSSFVELSAHRLRRPPNPWPGRISRLWGQDQIPHWDG